MAFTDEEVDKIDRTVGDFCQLRSPLRFRDQVRVGYSVKNHDVMIYESRPDWRNASEWITSEFAKLRYIRKSDEWKLYWKRASGKWLLYKTRTKSTRLPAMVREIDNDEYGCFFG